MRVKSLIILLLVAGCGSQDRVPTTPVIVPSVPVVVEEACKVLEQPRYSLQFSKLVCSLKKSEQNVPLKGIVLAQFIKETGRGHSRLAMKFNNFGGLKWRKEMKPYGNPISYDAWDGRTDYIEFDSIEAFITGYWHFIDRYPYKGWDRFKNDPHGYIKFINHAGYTPPKDYYKDVINLESEAKELLK